MEPEGSLRIYKSLPPVPIFSNGQFTYICEKYIQQEDSCLLRCDAVFKGMQCLHLQGLWIQEEFFLWNNSKHKPSNTV